MKLSINIEFDQNDTPDKVAQVLVALAEVGLGEDSTATKTTTEEPRKVPIKYDTDAILNRLWHGLRDNIYLAGQKCSVHFIELTPEERKNLE